MTDPAYVPEPRVPDRAVPRLMLALLLTGIAVGLVSVFASVIAARSSVARQEDVLENQRLLRAVCEQIRDVSDRFSSGPTPPPCPEGP